MVGLVVSPSCAWGTSPKQLKETLDRNFPGFADKMSNAQQQPGTLSEKTRVVQSDVSRNR